MITYAIIDKKGKCREIRNNTTPVLNEYYIPIETYDIDYLSKYYYPIPQDIKSFNGNWYIDSKHKIRW